MKRFKDQLTPSLLISSLALFVALGGISYAALGKNSVGSKQLKNNAVVTKKIKKNAVTTSKIKNDAVTGAKVKESSLGTVPNASNAAKSALADQATSADKLAGYSTFKQTRITATPGADAAAARLAAPENVVFTSGPVTIYTKCYTDMSVPRTYGYFFIKTSTNGVAFDSDTDELSGDPDFLNTDTLEAKRELLDVSASTNSAEIDADSSYATHVFTPSGTTFEMQPALAVKNGTLVGGNGLYGDGDACIFSATLSEISG